MNNNVRIIYLYIVSFITLGMIVVGIFSTVYNFTSYIYPTSYVFFEDDTYDYSYDITTTKNSREISKTNYKREKIKDGVVSLVVVALGGILYKYHWNISKENEKKGGM